MIDYQMGNNDYSTTVINKLSDSLKNTYLRKKSKQRAKRLRYKKNKENRETIIQNKYNETQDIEYNFELRGKSFYINELQSKILDYYIEHPDFSDYKKLADELKIGKTRFIREICCINNLTGIFKIKKMSENGIILNDLICNDIQNKITKSEDKQICKSFLPNIDNNSKILLKNKFALWDVIKSCNRDGSLDTNIKNEIPNNIQDLLKQFPNIKGNYSKRLQGIFCV